jgi:hypothetical protein
LDNPEDKDFDGTALEEAVMHGQIDMMKKIGLDPTRDDLGALLEKCLICKDEQLVALLLDAGADPNKQCGESTPMMSLMRNLEWTFDRDLRGWGSREVSFRCLELAAQHGGRWAPKEGYHFRGLRCALSKAGDYEVTDCLNRLMRSGAIDVEVFRKLMSTPQMKRRLEATDLRTGALRRFLGIKLKRQRAQT